MSGRKPGFEEAIAAEAERVLASPAFQRSEVLSRLLRYLVNTTIEGKTVKAFEIAVDGLGRDHHDSFEADTYARVVVARLRKALASFYASGSHEAELHIDPGSYVVRIERCDHRPAPLAALRAIAANPWARSDRAQLVVTWLLGIGLGLVLLAWFLAWQGDKSAWIHSNFPSIAVARIEGPAMPGAEECRQQMMTALGGYTGLRLVEAGTPADYEIRIFRNVSLGRPGLLVRLTHSPSRQLLWSFEAKGAEGCLEEAQMQELTNAIAAPGRLIESFARRQGVPPNTPYGCWLRFTRSIKTYNTIGNSELEKCARKWHSASPEHPVAAFLYSWTLLDQAAVAPLDITRARLLDKASGIARQASLLNSEFASLNIAQMRAASFRGDRMTVLTSARRAIDHAQNNPVIVGTAASGLAMWNEPEGERILLSRAHDPDQQMPWEHAALFVAAMMRDDAKAAGEQIEHLSEFDAGQPVLRLLQAAYLARIGKRRQADAVLARMDRDPRIWIAGRDTLIGRLPMAPEAKAQLKRWLATGAKRD